MNTQALALSFKLAAIVAAVLLAIGLPIAHWIAYSRLSPVHAEHGTDIAVLDERCIALTPLRIDITDEPTMTRLAELFAKGI